MAEYGLFPEDADERFSLRQMAVILQSRTRRKTNEFREHAHILWTMAFGDGKQEETQTTSSNNLAIFGIKTTEEGGGQ
jgi:hypothetical protein